MERIGNGLRAALHEFSVFIVEEMLRGVMLGGHPVAGLGQLLIPSPTVPRSLRQSARPRAESGSQLRGRGAKAAQHVHEALCCGGGGGERLVGGDLWELTAAVTELNNRLSGALAAGGAANWSDEFRGLCACGLLLSETVFEAATAPSLDRAQFVSFLGRLVALLFDLLR